MNHVVYKDMTQLYSDVGAREIAWAFGSAGSTLSGGRRAQLARLIESDTKRFGDVIKRVNISLE